MALHTQPDEIACCVQILTVLSPLQLASMFPAGRPVVVLAIFLSQILKNPLYF
jgi:hypothetical protein